MAGEMTKSAFAVHEPQARGFVGMNAKRRSAGATLPTWHEISGFELVFRGRLQIPAGFITVF